MEPRDGTSICRMTAASMYRHGVGAPFSAEQAAKIAQREYVILTGFGTLSKAPVDIFQSPDYSDSLS